MGRRWTAASSEEIDSGTATKLAGFDYRFGTVAVCATFVDSGGSQALVTTNDSSGNPAYLGWITGNQAWWDGGTVRIGHPTIAGPYISVATKTTGAQLVRFHLYDFPSATWLHADTFTADTSADAVLTNTLTLGGPTDWFNGDMFAVGMWPSQVMSDSEVERLARGNWLNMSPAFYTQFTDGREVGDMATTLGRNGVRQSAKVGTTRGAVKPPPGFRMDARRRRR